MSDLPSLIERLEQATGPSRELDAEILTTVLGYRDVTGEGYLFDRGNDGYWTLEGDEKNERLPSPTASIDAALTLVPKGWGWNLDSSRTVRLFAPSGEPSVGLYLDGRAPALALCIAALRARGA